MKLYLYSLRNRLSGIYERPVAEIYDNKEYIESLAQSLALAEIEVLSRYKEYDVYCLGFMDSKTGHITSNVDYLDTLEALCTGYIAAKEKKSDGQVSEQA